MWGDKLRVKLISADPQRGYIGLCPRIEAEPLHVQFIPAMRGTAIGISIENFSSHSRLFQNRNWLVLAKT